MSNLRAKSNRLNKHERFSTGTETDRTPLQEISGSDNPVEYLVSDPECILFYFADTYSSDIVQAG